MKRTRSLALVERQIEDAPARGTYALMARELALTAARRWPHLSVDQALRVLAGSRDVLRAADDAAQAVIDAGPERSQQERIGWRKATTTTEAK